MTKTIFKALLLATIILIGGIRLRAQIDVNHVMSIGRNALYFNDYIVAIGYFNRVIDTRPWMAEPYLYRSIGKISLEDYLGAERDATECILRNPYISKSYLVRGVARMNLKRFEEAQQDYAYGIKLAPNNGQMRYNLAVALLKMKKLEEADQAIDSLLYYSPRYEGSYALRAGIALERQDTTQALQYAEHAIRLDASQSIPYHIKASIAASRSHWFEAIDAISQVISIEGKVSDLYANRALMYYQANNLRSAMADYTTAIGIDPKHKISLHNRAILRQQVGEKTLALSDWDKFLELDSNNYIARYNRALLIIETGGDARKAIADLDAVVRQYPSFADGFLNRSILKRKIGNTRGAQNDYWRANELISNHNTRTTALAQARNNQRRATKQAEDQSIDKYALLIEGKSETTPDTRYTSHERGRVQDRDVTVEQQPICYLSLFAPNRQEGQKHIRDNHYAKLIEDFNANNPSDYSLRLRTSPDILTSEQIQELEALLSLPETKSEVNYYIRRGIIHSLLQDYEQAILDYNKALSLDGRNTLTLFARSIATMRYTETQSSRAKASLDLGITSPSVNLPNNPISTSNNSSVLDIIPSSLQDLGQLLMLEPSFAYGYYNRAVLYANSNNPRLAIADYSKALELNPKLAEAYYNRGLLLLAEGKHTEGIEDLSKAGELGLSQAYNIIKRMQ